MALDTQDKRLATISVCQAQNPSLPSPNNQLDSEDRAQLIFLARNVSQEVLSKRERLALMQVGMYAVMTLPDPDGDLEINDRRHLLSVARFEGESFPIPSTNLQFSSAAPTLVFLNKEILNDTAVTGQMALTGSAPVLTPNWVANDWWNPFWTLPLANFSSRQGDWWGPPDITGVANPPSTNLAFSTEAPSLVLESGSEIVIPSSDIVSSSESPSLLLGVHTVVTLPQANILFSSDSPILYLEATSEVVIPTAELSLSADLPAVAYYPDYQFEPPSRDLTIDSSAPVVSTKLTGLDLTTGDLSFNSDAPNVEVPPVVIPKSAGGRYGRPFAVFPQRKKRKLPEGPGIAAVQVGENVLVSRSPKVGIESPPLSATEAARMMRDLNRNLEQTGKTFTAEIKSFREAMEAREAAKEKKAKEEELRTLKKQKEALEQEIEKNQEMMAAILLLMVE